MRLNLKVVHKVYLGFGVILALLIASNLAAGGKLTQISVATLQVSNGAIPVFKLSNQLQIALLKQAKLSLLGFNNETLQQIEQNQTSFIEGNKAFDAIQGKLKNLVGNSSQLTNELALAVENYHAYSQAFDKMLNSVSERIKLNLRLNETSEAIGIAVNETGALLFELSDLAEIKLSKIDTAQPKNKGDIDMFGILAGESNQLDSHLFKFIDTSQEIIFMTDIDKAQAMKKELVFVLGDIRSKIVYVTSLTDQIDDNNIMATFLPEFERLSALLIGDNSLINIKLIQLTEIETARLQLDLAQTNVNTASSHLDALLKITDKQFNQLQDQVLAQVESGQDQLNITLLVVTICALVAVFFTSRSITVPLKGINQVLRYMAQGDLSRKLKVVSMDEFGELSTNINSVVSEITSLVEKIVQGSTKLTTNLAEVADNSAREIQEMSEFIEQQRTKVNEVNQITEHLDQSTGHVVQQAQTAVAEMLQAQQKSQRVDNIAQTNNKRITDLALNLDQTTVNIDKLQQESDLIGGIIETISGIADQTNLLALNAAIEAARAGEQGRGFAVVADEVRSLASRTQQSTTEIQAMIENLRTQTKSAVVDIASGKQQVTECVKYTDELTQSLSVINQAIHRIHSMNSEIADSAQQQQDESQEIKSKVMSVLHLAEKTGEKSQLTLEHSKKIASLADELEESVNSFKV
jgi:methyl-accepting chemotaxis protein